MTSQMITMRQSLLWTCFLAATLLIGTLWLSKDSTSHGMRKLLDVSRQPITPGYEDCDLHPKNEALAAFAKQALQRVRVVFCAAEGADAMVMQ